MAQQQQDRRLPAIGTMATFFLLSLLRSPDSACLFLSCYSKSKGLVQDTIQSQFPKPRASPGVHRGFLHESTAEGTNGTCREDLDGKSPAEFGETQD